MGNQQADQNIHYHFGRPRRKREREKEAEIQYEYIIAEKPPNMRKAIDIQL